MRPLEELISSQICPWPDFGAGEAAGGRNSAPVVAGDEGPVGERQEEGELYLWVARVGLGMARGGSSAEQGLRQRRLAAFRRKAGEVEAMGRAGSFTEPRGTYSPWWAAAAVPSKWGTRGLALELRRGEGESEDVSELARRV